MPRFERSPKIRGMRTPTARRNRPSLACEGLEDRRLMSVGGISNVKLNEVVLNAPSGTGSPNNRYVEIIGTGNESLDDGTNRLELVVFQGYNGASAPTGKAAYVYDLKGSKLGSNGLLVVDNPTNTLVSNFSPKVDAATTFIDDTNFSTANGVNYTSSTPTVALVSVPDSTSLTVGSSYAGESSLTLNLLPAGATILDSLSFVYNSTPDVAISATDPRPTDINYGPYLNLNGGTPSAATPSMATRFLGNLSSTSRTDDSTDPTFPFYYGKYVNNTTDPFVAYDSTVPANGIGQNSKNLPSTGGVLTPGGINGPVFTYSPTSYTTQEVAGSTAVQQITVTETNTSSANSVQYSTIDSGPNAGTAQAGTNYTHIAPTTLSFSGGIGSHAPVSKTFPLTILDDGVVASGLTVKLNLSSPSGGGYVDSTTIPATDTIIDGDGPTYFLSSTVYTGLSTAGTIPVTITRTGLTSVSGTVHIATTNGTGTGGAKAGTDYTAVSTDVSFPAGATSETVNVPVAATSVNAPSKTFTVTLSNPTGNDGLNPSASLNAPITASVTILNTTAPQLLLQQVDANPPSVDDAYEYIQISGPANATLYHTGVLVTDTSGTVSQFFDLSAKTLGSNGLLIIKSADTTSWQPAAGTTVLTTTFFNSTGTQLSHGSLTFLTISDPQPGVVANGSKLDSGNSGTLNLGAGGTVLDSFGWTSSSSDRIYSSVNLSLPGSSFAPNAAERLAGNTTPNSAAAWISGNLDDLDGHSSIAFDPYYGSGSTPQSIQGGVNNPSPIPLGAVLSPGYPTPSSTVAFGGNKTAPAETSLLAVQSITPTRDGFILQFNGDFDPTNVALYNTGTPSVTLTGASTGPITGNLVITNPNPAYNNVSGGQVTTVNNKDVVIFVATAADLPYGVLPADTYTVTVDGSDAGAFLKYGSPNGGSKLDGDRNGSAGGNYVTTFSVPTTVQAYPPQIANPAATGAGAIVGIPDFVAGNGQDINVPGYTGIPVILTNPSSTTLTNLSKVSVDIDYDGALLDVTAGSAGNAGGAFVFSPQGSAALAGKSYVSFTITFQPGGYLNVPAGGSVVLAYLTANVPSTAVYGTKEWIQPNRIVVSQANSPTGTTITAIPAIDSDSLHLAAYPGDINGDGQVDVFDVLAENDLANGDGATAYNNADPNLVADVTGDSAVDIFDVLAINDFANGNPSDTIPPINDSPNFNASGTPQDPILWVPANLAAAPGGSLSVPVDFAQTDRAAFSLSSFSLVVGYDPAAFAVNSVTAGSLDRGFALSYRVDAADGLIFISGASLSGQTLTPGTLGSLAEINLTARPGAPAGGSAINLMASAWAGNQTLVTSLNGGGLLLDPAPTNGVDAVDGVVTIGSASPSSPSSSPLQATLAAIDSALAASGGSIAGGSALADSLLAQIAADLSQVAAPFEVGSSLIAATPGTTRKAKA